MKKPWEMKPVLIWTNEYERRAFSTTTGAVKAYAEDMAYRLYFQFEKKYDKLDLEQWVVVKRLQKRATRRLIPIFEKLYNEPYKGFGAKKNDKI